ncbi:MAG: CPBP family intramembrane metalloprotease [Chloroflexi bacterium]|nr:CPBP family intramembrane metalloprotease [Chloroflexota bacterium]
MNSSYVSILLVISMAIVIVLPARRGSPGLGVLAGLALAAGAILWRSQALADFGFAPPESATSTLLLSLVLGLGLALASQMLIDPVVEKLTKQPHYISAVKAVRGNIANLLITLLAVWILVAFVEEFLYRGFILTELLNIVGRQPLGLFIALLTGAILFGLSHSYQGISGVWSTGILGLVFGLIFIYSGFNLWLPILTHGVIDTVLLIFIFLNVDQKLKHLLIRP